MRDALKSSSGPTGNRVRKRFYKYFVILYNIIQRLCYYKYNPSYIRWQNTYSPTEVHSNRLWVPI
jgi:hypothetical protein